MNDHAESGASAEHEIRRLLVRYGRSGHVAWFGTVHDLRVVRGDRVIVFTSLGEWPGDVLRVHEPAAAAPPTLSGEVLRRMTEADRAAIDASRRTASRLLELAREAVGGESSSLPHAAPGQGATTAPVIVIDAEVSLCGRFGIVQFAGRGGAALGPAAVRLADALGLDRVQWMSAEPSTAPVESPATTPSSGAREASADGADSAGGADGAREAANGVLRTARVLTAADESQLGKGARRERERLGMIGAYAQKVRGEPAERGERAATGARRRWMIRIRATAGGLTVGQLEQLAALAIRHGDGSLRLTMRQGLQMHGVTPGSAVEVIQDIQSLAMTTRGSCGNVFRNVSCCPLPPRSAAAVAARQLAITITQQWLPRAEWLRWVVDPELASENSMADAERDAAYSEGYLPHKWKVGVATSEDNCIDVLTNDVALVVRQPVGDAPLAVDCYVGGSLAYRPGVIGSAAMLAEPLGRMTVADVPDLLQGLTRLHREISTEGPRHWRRLKYLVRRLGTEEVAHRLEQQIGRPGIFSPLDQEKLSTSVPAWAGHPAWLPQIDGRWTRTIEVVGGRLRFGDDQAGESWLRLCRLGRSLRIGPRHSLMIEGIDAAGRRAADALIAGPLADVAAEVGIPASDRGPRVLACVALPTCPLAVAEAERAVPQWRQAVDSVAAEAALLAFPEDWTVSSGTHRPLSVAVSGCSNGCSHPLTSALGIVAEGPRLFRIFVGGDGRSLGLSIGTIGGPAELAGLLQSVAGRFRAGREPGEGFRDWWKRRRE